MRPEDRLHISRGSDPRGSRGDQMDQFDAVLTARLAGRSVPGARALSSDLAPLLTAADALAPLAQALPRAEFADRLEAQLRARAVDHAPTRPVTVAPPLHPQRELLARRRRFTPLVQGAIAACVMLGMTIGALTASAHPGAPFYPLRKVVEGIGTNLNGGQEAVARDNLQRASAALAAFNAAASQSDDDAATTALGQLTQADQQAASAISQVGAGSQRAALQSQLDSLHAQETPDLRAALSNLGWPARIQVTSALRALSATSLAVTSARISGASGDRVDGGRSGTATGDVTVTVSGAGFTPGAVLLINGRPAGTVDTVTPDRLTAHLASGTLNGRVTSVGVGEPDGSAASTTHVELDDSGARSGSTPEPGDQSTPGSASTPEPSGGGDSTPTTQGTPGSTH